MNPELERIKKLRDYHILDSAPSEEFDQVTKFTAKLFKTPISLVSLVDHHRQWFKSKVGIDICQTERSQSFCSHAIKNCEEVLVIEDARNDFRFSNNPLVLGSPNVVFYAGAPLVNKQGVALGTLSVIDTKARKFTPRERMLLQGLADIVVSNLERFKENHDNEIEARKSKLALENMPSYILFKDNKNNIIFANRAIANALGLEPSDMARQSTEKLFPEFSESYYQDDLEVISTGRAKFHIMERFFDSQQQERWLSTDKIPIFGENGKVESVLVVANDITEKKTLEERLQIEFNLKSAILDSSHFSVISTDESGLIKIFSKGAENLLGYSAEEIVNKVALDKFHDTREIEQRAEIISLERNQSIPPGFFVVIDKTTSNKVDEREWTYVKKDGSKLPVSLSISRLFDSTENISGYVVVIKDLSSQKTVKHSQAICNALGEKIDDLKFAIKRKSEFFATMSHEIRTPLTSIISLATLMKGASANSEFNEDVSCVLDSANHLRNIIGAILDFAKIESGKMGITVMSINPEQVFSDIIKYLNFSTRAKKQIPITDIQRDIPNKLSLDFSRVKQVIFNLISNAVKFSEEGSRISLSIKYKDSTLYFLIEDEGVGIAPDKIDLVFEPYVQVDGSYSRKEGGIGLGLPLSKALVEIMGGNILLTSDGCKGTKVEVYIPVEEEMDDSKTINNVSYSLKGKRVLFAEDNVVNRLAISRLLSGLGFEVVEAVDGTEVLTKMEENFDLILLDIHMPKMNGLEVLKKLSQDKISERIPVVMLSACALHDEIAYTQELGAKGFIAKPINHSQFEIQIKTVLQDFN